MKLLTSTALSILLVSLASGVYGQELKSAVQFQRDRESVCTEDWTKRGVLDQGMYNYCIEQQSDAYSDLVSFHGQYSSQDWYSTHAFPYCYNEWTKRDVSNAQMIHYCLNEELEGVKDYQYYREQYDAATVDQVANQAMATFKSWNMVAYQIERHFEK